MLFLVHFSNDSHGKDATRAWFPSGKYFQTPESAKDILDMASFDQESRHGNANTLDEFSAACPQSGNMGPLSDIPNLQQCADNSNAPSFSAKGNNLSRSSLVWPGSPVTPMAEFSGSKVLQESEFDFGLSNNMQDDTPEILKDTPTPINTVKASSPNKKRVSPPHGRPQEFSSSSSTGLRTGRKFILKSVPAFPPLTPCIDSKTPGVQQDNFPENRDANK